jgi:hypothetical protein
LERIVRLPPVLHLKQERGTEAGPLDALAHVWSQLEETTCEKSNAYWLMPSF